uniref:Uncharacterized protein n=1 Tax=Globodera rostochiensis TaxID=31243 RepID=A0A914HDX0_GLORO
MMTRKRQKLPNVQDGKKIVPKKAKGSEKENVEEFRLNSADDSLIQKLDSAFLVKHPPELLNFWSHAVKLNGERPLEAFAEMDSLKLGKKQRDYLLASRFPMDLPEMETILVHDGGHFCYWCDVPNELPSCLVHVNAQKEHFPAITIVGELNIFAAIQYLLLTTKPKQLAENSGRFAHLFPEKYDLSGYGPNYLQTLKKRRSKQSIGMPFHGLGIKVHVDKRGIGYRPVSENNSENARLKKNIEAMGTTDSEETKKALKEKFFKLFSWVQFANDEMDFGMGLEFGHDLFISNYACFDGVRHNSWEAFGKEASS